MQTYFSQELKFKKLSQKEITLAIDRLTRFKNPLIKYRRVFLDIILSCLISPHLNKKNLETLDICQIINLAEKIFNNSFNKNSNNLFINEFLKNYENSVFILNSETQKLLNNKLNWDAAIKTVEKTKIKNLKWLVEIKNNTKKNIINLRKEKLLKYPIEKIILVEGATEEILLPKFSALCNYDFDKYGIQLIPAGGKNQVARKYFELSNEVKIPIKILLDSDAIEIEQIINQKLRKIDEIILIKNGEFEDILPLKLIKKTLNSIHETEFKILINELKTGEKTVHTLENIFKQKGWGEFKKVKFAKAVFENSKNKTDLNDIILEIIEKIKS